MNLVTPQQMRAKKEIIQKVYDEFTKNMDQFLKRNRGICTDQDINKIIKKSKKQFKLSFPEQHVIEGFFDTYVGLWGRGGDRKETAAFVSYILGDNEEEIAATKESDVKITNNPADIEKMKAEGYEILDLRDKEMTKENAGEVIEDALFDMWEKTERAQELIQKWEKTQSLDDQMRMSASFEAFKIMMLEKGIQNIGDPKYDQD